MGENKKTRENPMDIEIKQKFNFLVEKYGFKYEYQRFELTGGWKQSAHSFYNASGCFTIHSMTYGGELCFYHADKFSTNKHELYKTWIDVFSVEKEIWEKYTKFLFFNTDILLGNDRRVLKAVAEIVETQINRQGEFFGIRIDNIKP